MKHLQKVHFFILLVAIINLLVQYFAGWFLVYGLRYTLYILLFFTGIVLFLKNIRPFHRIAIYFSIYVLPVIFFGTFYLSGDMQQVAILRQLTYQTTSGQGQPYHFDNIILTPIGTTNEGTCCIYRVVKKYFVIKQELGLVHLSENYLQKVAKIQLENRKKLRVIVRDKNGNKTTEELDIAR